MAASINVLKRGLATSSALSNAIKHVTVIGGGLMGSGIAQVGVDSLNSIITGYLLIVS